MVMGNLPLHFLVWFIFGLKYHTKWVIRYQSYDLDLFITIPVKDIVISYKSHAPALSDHNSAHFELNINKAAFVVLEL